MGTDASPQQVGVSTLVNPATGGAVAWCSNWVGSRSQSSRAASAARRCHDSPTRIGCSQPHVRRSTCLCPFSARSERGLVWICAGRKGQVQLALAHFTEGRDRSNPRDLGRASWKRCLPLRGRIVHFLVMRDRLPWGAKCSIVSKTGAPMQFRCADPRIPSTGCALSGVY